MSFPLINIKFILLISASFIAIFSSIAIYFCLPILISHIIRSQITLSANSGSFEQWRTNSVIDRIYLFNITNLNELLLSSSSSSSLEETTTPLSTTILSSPTLTNNSERSSSSIVVPKLKEIGPFTYRQIREKINIKFNELNETVLYDQRKSWHYLPELSITNDLNSLWINHINVPLVGTALNPEYAEFVDLVIQENDLRLFLNHSVAALLFEGYFDILMEQAKASGQIDVDQFGWMHNQNNTLTKAIRIFTGNSNGTLDKFGSLDEFEFRKQFRIWHNALQKSTDFNNVQCNQFRFTSAGEFFPPSKYSFISYNNYDNLIQHNENNDQPEVAPRASLGQNVEQQQHSVKSSSSISIFMPDLCRTIRLFYNNSHEHKGLQVDRYIANENTYKYWLNQQDNNQNQNNNDEIEEIIKSNKCYCIYNETSQLLNCPPNGMMDMYQCRKGSPVTISFPYFLYYQQDPTLRPFMRLFEFENKQQSHRFDDEQYQFFIDLEPTLNLPVNVQIVLQFNVHLKNEQQFNFTKEYSYLFNDPQMGSGNNKVLPDFYLPQMWIKSTAEIDHSNLNNLIFIQKHLNLITPSATIIIFACASILLMASAKLAYDLTYGPNARKCQLACDEESCCASSSTTNSSSSSSSSSSSASSSTRTTTKRANHLCSALSADNEKQIFNKQKCLDIQLLTNKCNLITTKQKESNKEKSDKDSRQFCACKNKKQQTTSNSSELPTTSTKTKTKTAASSCGDISSINNHHQQAKLNDRNSMTKINERKFDLNQSEESQPLNRSIGDT